MKVKCTDCDRATGIVIKLKYVASFIFFACVPLDHPVALHTKITFCKEYTKKILG